MSNKYDITTLREMAERGELPPIAGAAVDENGLLFADPAFNGTSANGTPITIGRNPNRNAEVVLFVETAETTEGSLTCTVKMSLDGTNYNFTVCTLVQGTDAVGFAGITTGKCTWPVVAWEKYDPTKIKLRATVVDGDNDGASAWGHVAVYIGYGEEFVYGRAPGVADDIVGD